MDQSQIIALKDVESSYKTKNAEQLYLKSISLSVDAGETIAIIGRSGAGKSALLRCIALLDRPLTGIIAIDNKNLTFLASKELCSERRAVGYISSKPTLLNNKNLLQNIALPLQIQGYTKAEIKQPVEQALTRVNLDSKAYEYPENLTVLQKIQTEIARCLVNNPKILLCDDIFSGLDQKATESLIALLKQLQNDLKITIMMTCNDAEIIKALCSSVIVMHQGKIVETCTIYTLFTQPQSEVAKDFIRFATKHELPNSLRRKISSQETTDNHALLKISFSECLNPEEIIRQALEAYDLKMNIIQAYQEKIQAQVVNILLIEIYGSGTVLADVITFLNTNSLQSEIIGYVPNIN